MNRIQELLTVLAVSVLALAAVVTGAGVTNLLTRPAAAQDPGLPIVPLGYCQLTSAAAMPLTGCAGGIPAGAKMAMVTVSTNPVRFRDDGVAPTAALGVTLPVTTAGLPFAYNGRLSAISFIPTTGSATLDVLFYR